MKNSQQHLGNEANLATFSLSHDVIFFMVSPVLGRFLVSFNLQSAICGQLQSAVCKCHTLQFKGIFNKTANYTILYFLFGNN